MNLQEQFQQYRDKQNALNLALTTMNYDLFTIAPKDGNPYRHKMMNILFEEAVKLEKDPDFIKVVTQLNDTTQDEDVKRDTDIFLKRYNKTKNVSVELQSKFFALTLEANDVWEEAKNKNRYDLFEPYLLKLIEITKEVVDTIEPKVENVYETLLDDYEEGLTIAQLDEFFGILNDRLVPFIQKINNANLKEPEFLSRPVDIETQKKITQLIADYVGFDSSFSYIAETEHPFSSTLSINDSRITTHYHQDMFTSNIFSIIHEIGHSFYNHQVDEKYEGMWIADAMSMGMHESQSRFLENNIGRSKAFWTPLYSQLKELAHSALHDVDLDEFIYGINFPKLSLIRIEADELTYALHVLVRYNLERMMIVDSKTENLNEVWKQEYGRVLGIAPESDSKGILQDVHWSQASFGYFPTYALGSAYAAQFFDTLKQQINVDEVLSSGQFSVIREWLKENIHQYGGKYTSQQMLQRVTHKPFDANIYCDYLIEKFSALYLQ